MKENASILPSIHSMWIGEFFPLWYCNLTLGSHQNAMISVATASVADCSGGGPTGWLTYVQPAHTWIESWPIPAELWSIYGQPKIATSDLKGPVQILKWIVLCPEIVTFKIIKVQIPQQPSRSFYSIFCIMKIWLAAEDNSNFRICTDNRSVHGCVWLEKKKVHNILTAM